ncbi:MAG: protein-export chaperone SecB [Rhodoferax sp.]|nr:protein-export chaperone SecB [Rhodoferax sp.]MDP3653197.1 protein-export chaperone SecB [Rhodoferax sp.]
MQLSPLQMLEYTFDGVSVMPVEGYAADPAFAPGLVFFPGKLAMSADTGLALLDENEKYSDFGVKLTLRVGPKEDAQAPYNIQVSVRGVVRMHLTQVIGQAEERRVRALVNGVSLLYGAVREMVSTITSRSAHGPFLLPSLSFQDLVSHKPDEVALAVLQSSAPAKRKSTVVRVKAKD